MKRKFILLPIITSLSVLSPLSSCKHESHLNLDKIKSNYFDILIHTAPTNFTLMDGTTGDYKDMSAEEIQTQQLVPDRRKGLLDKEYDGFKFKDLDYSNPDRATWQAHLHIERMLHLAVDAYNQHDEAKMELATKLTIWWVQDDLWNPNWWFNTIGVPRDLSAVGMILMDRLPYSAQQRLLEIVRRGSFKYCPSTRTYTGANLFWYGDITLKCGLLENDEEAIKMMIKYVSDGIVEDEDEGFQHDGTFFQHGRQIYNGGYGRQAPTLLAPIIASFAGSGYKWPIEKLNILTNYIVNGIRTTTHKGQISYLTMGRAHCRKNSMNVNGLWTDLGNIFVFKYLTNLENCPHKDEINDMLDALEKKDRANFEGIKCFPSSSMISMNVGDDVFISFKGIRNDLIGSEQANSENVMGHNFAFGANTCVMQTGEEYADIAPNWDYAHLPGTTTIDETDEELLKYNDSDYKIATKSEGPFFCGEDQGVAFCMQKAFHGYRNGTEAEGELPKDRVNYTITCFATENGMAILGADINFVSSLGDTKNLTTTVEQCITNQDIPPTKVPFFTYNAVVYKNIQASYFDVVSETRNWSWHRNKDSYKASDKQQQKILTIKINSEDSSQYAYSIQPVCKSLFNFVVASNTKDIQAVDIGNNKLAVACYTPGASFEYDLQTYTIDKAGYSVIDTK